MNQEIELKDEIHTHVRAILEAPNPEAARLLLQQTLAAYEDKAAKAMRILVEYLEWRESRPKSVSKVTRIM